MTRSFLLLFVGASALFAGEAPAPTPACNQTVRDANGAIIETQRKTATGTTVRDADGKLLRTEKETSNSSTSAPSPKK